MTSLTQVMNCNAPGWCGFHMGWLFIPGWLYIKHCAMDWSHFASSPTSYPSDSHGC